jgi:hypothetical protein
MGNCPLSNFLEDGRCPIVLRRRSAGLGTFRKMYDEIKTWNHQSCGIGAQQRLTDVQLSSHCMNFWLSLQKGLQVVAEKWWEGRTFHQHLISG